MQKYILYCISFLFCWNLNAQEILPCGTPPVKSEWLKKYQANPDMYSKGADSTLYVPVTIHILGTFEGAGYYDIPNVLSNFCKLNADFEPSGIQFYISGEIRYVDNTEWYDHDDYPAGYQMMSLNNVPNTINSYIVRTAAGAGGYYAPGRDALTVTIANMNLDTWHTWAHEVGHYLTLPHPFLGWEGIEYNFDTITPLVVGGWGNVEVEFVDGSNCTEAADGFCDTPPDYLSAVYACNDDSMSIQLQKDPDSVQFRSDARNFMNYADGACQGIFTPQQQAAMRANLIDDRPAHLTNQDIPREPITEMPTLYEAEVGDYNTTLTWSNVPNANRYYYEVNRLSNFSPSFAVTEGLVSDTTAVVGGGMLNENTTYYWRIHPFSDGYTCTEASDGASFMTGTLTDVESVMKLDRIALYPNMVAKGQSATLEFDVSSSVAIQVHIFDMNGQHISTLFDGQINGSFTQNINHHQLDAGMYLVAIESNGLMTYRKLVCL